MRQKTRGSVNSTKVLTYKICRRIKHWLFVKWYRSRNLISRLRSIHPAVGLVIFSILVAIRLPIIINNAAVWILAWFSWLGFYIEHIRSQRENISLLAIGDKQFALINWSSNNIFVVEQINIISRSGSETGSIKSVHRSENLLPTSESVTSSAKLPQIILPHDFIIIDTEKSSFGADARLVVRCVGSRGRFYKFHSLRDLRGHISGVVEPSGSQPSGSDAGT